MKYKRTIWDFWAHYYERLWVQHFILGPTRIFVIKHIKASASSSKHLLDLGCGVGQFCREIAIQLPSLIIHGIDPSIGMITKAKNAYSGKNITYSHELLAEQHAKKKYDLVTCLHAFPYISDKPSTIKFIYSILNKYGRFLLVQPNPRSFYDQFCLKFVKLTTTRADYLGFDTLSKYFKETGFIVRKHDIVKHPLIPKISLLEGIKNE